MQLKNEGERERKKLYEEEGDCYFLLYTTPAVVCKKFKQAIQDNFMPVIESGNTKMKAILKSSRDVCDISDE